MYNNKSNDNVMMWEVFKNWSNIRPFKMWMTTGQFKLFNCKTGVCYNCKCGSEPSPKLGPNANNKESVEERQYVFTSFEEKEKGCSA